MEVAGSWGQSSSFEGCKGSGDGVCNTRKAPNATLLIYLKMS